MSEMPDEIYIIRVSGNDDLVGGDWKDSETASKPHTKYIRADKPADLSPKSQGEAINAIKSHMSKANPEPFVFTEQEREDMSAAFKRCEAAGKGHYEILFSVASVILRSRALSAAKPDALGLEAAHENALRGIYKYCGGHNPTASSKFMEKARSAFRAARINADKS